MQKKQKNKNKKNKQKRVPRYLFKVLNGVIDQVNSPHSFLVVAKTD